MLHLWSTIMIEYTKHLSEQNKCFNFRMNICVCLDFSLKKMVTTSRHTTGGKSKPVFSIKKVEMKIHALTERLILREILPTEAN